jgi:8-oxo-dGTP diphosphatase
MPQEKEFRNPDIYEVLKSDRPAVVVLTVIFTVKDNDLKALLVKRKRAPFEGFWALPNGFLPMDVSLDDTAKNVLMHETGVKDVYLEQLYTFGDPKRHPVTRVIGVTYFALVNSDHIEPHASGDVSDAKWISVSDLPKLAFDHKKIIEHAVHRLQAKLEYSTVAFSLLPKKFTLTQLQKVYEVIMNKTFDKRNFRKKILSLNIVEETKETTANVSHRPAKLYSFKRKIGEIVEII